MQIRPVGSNELPFPYKKGNKGVNEQDMVYEPKEDTIFPPKLKAIIIIPKGSIEGEDTNESKDTFSKT